MPDLVLRQIFAEYDYAVLCKMERVCKRWMNIINAKFRKEIHEVSIERLGSSFPQTHQCIPFRRLSISCPSDSHDFLAGVFRRSRLSILKMTTDINFLAGIDQIYVAKDTGRRYFSNVEDLWLLIIHPDDDVTQRFLSIEETLFSELNQLTLQVHVNPRYYRNVSEIVKSFILRYPKSNINLELHAEKSMHILNQMSVLPSLPLYKIKLICTDF
uniref:F-box domain-containing protein n=1 Tax=Caenorhabditis japonica TaxID=281687 RepID=A0A8R1DK95_CAEJA